MKHLFSLTILLAVLLTGGGLSGCSDDKTNTPSNQPTAELAAGETTSSSAALNLTTAHIQEYAYSVTTKLTETAPTAAVLFGTGTKGIPVDGVNVINIQGLDGDTEYMAFVATKSEAGYGEVLSVKFRTKGYTGLLTFVEADYFKIKFHIEVPAGKTIAYAVVDRDIYYGMMNQFGKIDPEYLEGAKEMVTVVDKSTTITFDGWYDGDPETEEFTHVPILPGQALTLMVAEVVEGEPDFYDRDTWAVLFDWEGYTESQIGGMNISSVLQQAGDVAPFEKFWKTEYHDQMLVGCKPAERMNAHVAVEPTAHTVSSITLAFTPDPALLGYGFIYMDMATWETYIDLLGEDGTISWWTANGGMELLTEPVSATVNDLQLGITYRMLICGVGNEERTLQSVDFYDFTAKEPTKPAPKVVVTGISAPTGQVESPWKVWFNVKAPNHDVVAAKYLCNTRNEWTKSLNGGATYSAMLAQYGVEIPANDVEQMNSASGLNMSFDTWEETVNRLAIAGYNDELTPSSPDLDADGKAEMLSISEIPATPVSSPLFTELLGEWTATVIRRVKVYDPETKKQVWINETEPRTAKVNITTEPYHPDVCPEEVYGLFPGNTREEVEAIFNDYVATSKKYAGKVRGQNRLLCEGLDITDYSTLSGYQSAWDLFCSPYFSSYSSDDCFYAAGPKWHLQIAEGDQITIPVDVTRVAPAAGWDTYYTYYLVGLSDEESVTDLTSFGVTLSADKQTLTVNQAVKDDKSYDLSYASISQWGVTSQARCASLVLTKGWAGTTGRVAKQASSKPVTMPTATPVNIVKSYHKTRLGKVASTANYKQVELNPFSMEDYQAKLQKIAAKRNGRR